jgi:hypothetical protein
MKHIIFLFIGGLFMLSSSFAQQFEVGQIWEYKTRPNELASRLTIVKIDVLPNDVTIIHISLTGLNIKSPQSPRGISDTASHLPLVETSVRESVTKLVGTTTDLPDFEEGYNMWKEAFDSGQGGYFTITVDKCVEYMEAAINQQ